MVINDEQQRRVAEFSGDAALVLGGPGCGKTRVLAQRILKAIDTGYIDPASMLCVTFTNRAAREMKQRIADYAGYVPLSLFVGNMHRFCLRFLTTNELIAADTSVLDEQDRDEYLATLLPYHSQAAINDFLCKAAFIYQKSKDHPHWIMRTPKTPVTTDDFEAVCRYIDFKNEHRLIDYDDILLQTYTALMQVDKMDYDMTGYSWVQVDEVQDMTPLQLAIVEAVSRRINRTVVYFGDEQQAIFNFIGAGGRALEHVKAMCRHNIMHLNRNYRSPRILVEMCNRIACERLGLPPALLPRPTDTGFDGEMTMHRCSNDEQAALMAAHICRQWAQQYADQSIAVLVRSNKEGDSVSETFAAAGLQAFHITRRDLFHSISYKTVWSHLAAVCRPHLNQPWVQLLYRTRAVRTLTEARKLVKQLTSSGISPCELLNFDMPAKLEHFCRLIQSETTIVVFDTETTGLDPLNDDIVQIAAVKMRGTEIVPGSEFEVFINTDKPLPSQLSSGQPNTFVRTYARAEKTDAATALKAFFDYAGSDAVLCGHNTLFDCSMITNNVQRRTTLDIPSSFSPQAPIIDTLEISRLTMPRLMSHTLENIIKALGTEGCNSHNASDDVRATANIIAPLFEQAKKLLPLTALAKQDENIRKAAQRLCKAYGNYYAQSLLMFNRTTLSPDNTLAGMFVDAAGFFYTNGFAGQIQHLDYVIELIDKCIVNPGEHTFRQQVSEHLFELLSFNEADFFANGIIREQISITTVHKAKGLEMDNVVVYNANTGFGSETEQARVLYVAFSRARKRLAVGYTGSNLSPCVRSVAHMFKQTPAETVLNAVSAERDHIMRRR